MSLEKKGPKSVSAAFEELEAEMLPYKEISACGEDKEQLKYKGIGIALSHIKKIILPEIFELVILSPDQMIFIKGALNEAVRIEDHSSPAYPKNFVLAPSLSTSILSIAAYLNSLMPSVITSLPDLGQSHIQQQIAQVVKK